jgi:hypothetical protein
MDLVLHTFYIIHGRSHFMDHDPFQGRGLTLYSSIILEQKTWVLTIYYEQLFWNFEKKLQKLFTNFELNVTFITCLFVLT